MTLLARLFALIALILAPAAAHAESQDVAATVRGVVRVVIIATNGEQSYFVGHGSGFAVAPDKVLTNAHVVEMLRTEPNLLLGIIPSEGTKSYGGRIVAFSPGNDLALVQLREGRLPVATFFAGAVNDGQSVTAIGYPGAVDRAQGLSLNELIQPASPVKTVGTVSMGRSSHSFDTLLHTAPMAQGNSGGPLVDDCGRVLGVNSFGSQAESEADAEFGFAVSNREIGSFLRQAGVQFQRTAVPCRTIADLDAAEARLAQEQAQRTQEQARLADEARDKWLAKARDSAEQEVIAGRENAIAIAGVLLVLGGLALGFAMVLHGRGEARRRNYVVAGGGVLLLGAIAAFYLRPSFSGVEDRLHLPENMTAPVDGAQPGYDPAGDNLCRIDEGRSRITVSDTRDVPVNWTADGCVNGNTQYGEDDMTGAGSWSRIFVPATEPAVSINSFDPKTGTYRTERYLPDAQTLEKARQLRARFTLGKCSADPDLLARLQQMQAEIRAVLPPQPHERLVYRCTKGPPPGER